MSDNEVSKSAPKQMWAVELGLNVSQTPLILGNHLVIAAQASGRTVLDSSLIALDLATSQKRWQLDFEYALVSGLQRSRTGADRRDVAIVSTSSSDPLKGQGAVLAVDENGDTVWHWQASEQSYSAPAVVENQIYVTAGAKALVNVCPEAGGRCDEQRIFLEVSRASHLAPAIRDGVAYVPCRGPELLAVGLDGNVRWHFKLQGSSREWLDRTPVVDDGLLFSPTSQGNLLAVDAAAGTMVWRTQIGEGRPLGDPVVSRERILVGFHQGVAALDKPTGRVIWSFATSRPVSTAPVVLNDLILFTCEDRHLYAVELGDGTERWRHLMTRRIEVPPVLTKDRLIVADRGGHIVALAAPELIAAVVEASETDTDPAVVQTFRRKSAEEYEAKGKSLEAAELWLEIGELERAADQFELASAWLRAAELWQQMDRYGKRAQALRRHARAVSNEEVGDEEKAAAWEQAARAYAETGQKEIRIQCEREVARYRQQAIITLDVEAVNLAVDSWSKLNYTLRNEGFGVARHVDVKLRGDQFEGQHARTQTIITLKPGQEYSHWIDVSPKDHGSSVPMNLAVEYVDKEGKLHVLDRTQYLAVAAPTAPLTQTGWTQPADIGDTAGLFARLPAPDGKSLPELREKIVQHFSRDELKEVIFELGLLEDNFDEKISVMAKELVLLMSRHDRLAELVTKLQEANASFDW